MNEIAMERYENLSGLFHWLQTYYKNPFANPFLFRDEKQAYLCGTTKEILLEDRLQRLQRNGVPEAYRNEEEVIIRRLWDSSQSRTKLLFVFNFAKKYWTDLTIDYVELVPQNPNKYVLPLED